MQRLFLGIELPDSIHRKINFTLQAKIPGARWVRENQHHLTLLFLGETSPDKYDQVIDFACSVKSSPFTIHLKGVNLLGPARSPKVLYLAVEENESLCKLQKQLVKAAFNHQFQLEKRKFLPHVTLARMRYPSTEHLGAFIMENALVEFDAFEVNYVSLFESHLSQEGATYRVREKFYLD